MTDSERWGGPGAAGLMNTGINAAEAVLNNGSQPTVLWSEATGGAIKTRAVVVGANVFFGADDKKMRCRNATTGAVVWTSATLGDKIRSTPHVLGGVCYFGCDDGKFYALNSGTGATAAGWAGPYSVPGLPKIRSHPIVSGTRVLFGTDNGKVYALNIADGTLSWSFDTTAGSAGAVEGALAIYNANVYVPSLNGSMYSLVVATGAPVRTFLARGAVTSPCLATDTSSVTHLIFGSADHRLYDYDADTGKKIWSDLQAGDVLAPVAIDTVTARLINGEHNWRVGSRILYTGARVWLRDGTASSGVVTAAFISRNGGGDVHPLVADVWPISTTGGNGDGRVGLWEVTSGAGGQVPFWKYPATPSSGNPFNTADPLIVNGKIYVGSDNGVTSGTFYCFS